MNKKKLHRILCFSLLIVSGFFSLICCVMIICWDFDPMYELNHPAEDALEIQTRSLGSAYSCLKFVDGLLWHGKDTSAIAKFRIDKSDASWEALSNRIYVAKSHDSECSYVLQDSRFTANDERIGALAKTTEKFCAVLVNGWISLRVSYDIDQTEYLYITGVEIPGRPDDRNIHFKKRYTR